MVWYSEADHVATIPSSYEKLFEDDRKELQPLAKSGHSLIGYVFPRAPIELLLAHRLMPTLLRADPKTSGGYEGSLQTFCCAYARNLFSQRATGRLPPLTGIIFPGGACDSLQNVADVWRFRYPTDSVFRLAYPAAPQAKGATDYFAEELRSLSRLLETKYKEPFSAQRFKDAVALSTRFHEAAQFIAAARVVNPQVLPYAQFAALVRRYLTAPDSKAITQLDTALASVKEKLDKKERTTVEGVQQGLLNRRLKDLKLPKNSSAPRIIVVGGMVDPSALGTLVHPTGRTSAEIVLDVLSFGFRTIFTQSPQLRGDPFEATARALLGAPTEPTQEGLPNRLAFLTKLLRQLRIDGLVVCEQSFCDPDEFEAPSVAAIAAKVGIPTTRLQVDPELSDRARVEGKIHSFLETITARQ